MSALEVRIGQVVEMHDESIARSAAVFLFVVKVEWFPGRQLRRESRHVMESKA